jgi:hypothetical protein
VTVRDGFEVSGPAIALGLIAMADAFVTMFCSGMFMHGD